jgi:hypothetical protein
MVVEIESIFPKLGTAPYRITSPRTRDYNCIAWAVGEVTSWWWPTTDPDDAAYWPAGIPKEEILDAFLAAFATLGYYPFDSEMHEPGYEKVALFANPEGVPTHAARQLPDGRWTSKLGRLEDIEHSLRDIEGELYGTVVRVLRRLVLPPSS